MTIMRTHTFHFGSEAEAATTQVVTRTPHLTVDMSTEA